MDALSSLLHKRPTGLLEWSDFDTDSDEELMVHMCMYALATIAAETPESADDAIARPPRATKKRRPALSAIPDERPATKRRTIMREECDTAASIVRNQRLDERVNVNNGVISGSGLAGV
jgi:hypothetical protein